MTRSSKNIIAALLIAACAAVAALLWARQFLGSASQPPQKGLSEMSVLPQPSATPPKETFPEMSAFAAVTPYGYNRATMDVAAWQIAQSVKEDVEGKEGCHALYEREGAYLPVSFQRRRALRSREKKRRDDRLRCRVRLGV